MMKKRFFYALLTVIILIVALFIRTMWAYLPNFINIWIGDYLWAVMLFWAAMGDFLHLNKQKIALALIVFCWTIEVSQAFHTPTLDAFRNTTFGGLLLGHGFLWSDIIAYTTGVANAYFVDKRFLKSF